jgi:hypothetical protein
VRSLGPASAFYPHTDLQPFVFSEKFPKYFRPTKVMKDVSHFQVIEIQAILVIVGFLGSDSQPKQQVNNVDFITVITFLSGTDIFDFGRPISGCQCVQGGLSSPSYLRGKNNARFCSAQRITVLRFETSTSHDHSTHNIADLQLPDSVRANSNFGVKAGDLLIIAYLFRKGHA